MPDFRPFPALRYAHDIPLSEVLAPPYDVLSEAQVAELHARHRYNITRVDVPENQDYAMAAQRLWRWVENGVLTADTWDTLSIYRMAFTDAGGTAREIVGVLGGLEVVDETTTGTTVLPHENITPRARTDRLDLTRATATNLSPVWGLSLAGGLTDALREPGQREGQVEWAGATHTVEKVSDPDRIAAIRAIIAADDVLIADGHHRYSVARTYRDEVRAATKRRDTPAEQTLAFVNELIEDQLCIEASHRLYSGASADALRAGLERCFDFAPAGPVTAGTLGEMERTGRLVVLWRDGGAQWLTPKPGVFAGVRALDGLWLETALEGVDAEVDYQNGLAATLDRLGTGDTVAAVLIRPTSIEEIRRTAREGVLMPPKSTFFTPKLLTGWVLRPTQPLPTP